MFAITQTQYYLTLLKYILYTIGGFSAAFIFLGIVYGIVYFSHYWR